MTLATKSEKKIYNIITFDLEEWFHILDLPSLPCLSQWDSLESRVEFGLNKFLEALSESNTSCTFFVLGWIAERYPDLIKRIAMSNHEIASHGFLHELITQQNFESFSADIRKSKSILEDLIGKPVYGYRGPGFSITSENTWAFEAILSEGYTYDSSLFSGHHGHGGIPSVPITPFRIKTPIGKLIEFPIPTVSAGPLNTAFSGGGYFRLFPAFLINRLIRFFNSKGKPVLSYLHPRDLDPDTPKLKMPMIRKFKCYINLKSTYKKLTSTLSKNSFVSIHEWLKCDDYIMPDIELSNMTNQS